jgi:hypothetical protein
MTNRTRRLWVAGISALLVGAPAVASAQDVNAGATPAPAPAPPPPPAPTYGTPQLRDFQLQPRERIVTQPPVAQPPVVQLSPPPPNAATPPAAQPRPAPARPGAAPVRPAPETTTTSQPTTAAPSPETAAPAPAPVETAPAPAPNAAPAPAAPEGGSFPWLVAVPVALLALIGFALFRSRRRRRAEIEEAVEAAPLVAAEAPAPPPVRSEAEPRPWLELELKAERAQATDAETMVQFVLDITNSGKAPARNLRIDVKMFNAGQQQDQELTAFFRTAGRDSTKCSLPGIAPDTTGSIRGEVAMPRDEMRAVVLENKYLFIPVLAVNALYDYGDGQTGQTSKSYVVGRELEQPSDKMGAFRVDQGPRIWRTVGQRQHKLARRV